MKKNIINLLIFIVTSCFVACNKNQIIKPKETPITDYLKNNYTASISIASSPFELGQIFSTSVKGKIIAIGCKMPLIGRYHISIWEEKTKKLLQTGTVSIKANYMLDPTFQNIEAFEILPNKKYVISINTTSEGTLKPYYVYSNPIMPFTHGSVTMHGSNGAYSNKPIFPDYNGFHEYLYGYPDFTFIAD